VAADRRRDKTERDLVARVRVFGNVQTALDQEAFTDGLVCSYPPFALDPLRRSLNPNTTLDERVLRRRIAELQDYKRAGITTFAEADKYERDKAARACIFRNSRATCLLTRNPKQISSRNGYHDSILSYDRKAARDSRPGSVLERRPTGSASDSSVFTAPVRRRIRM
jgi:hypothetical protein